MCIPPRSNRDNEERDVEVCCASIDIFMSAIALTPIHRSYRINFGLTWLHVAVSSKHPLVRQAALESLKQLVRQSPREIHTTMLDALKSYVSKPSTEINAVLAASDEAPSKSVGKERVAPVVLVLASFPEEMKKNMKEKIMAQWLVLAHHPLIGECLARANYNR